MSISLHELGADPSSADGPVAFTSSLPVGRVTQSRVVRSEWVKLFSLRSSWITLALGVASMAGIGILAGFVTNANWSHMRPGRIASFDPVGSSLAGVNFAQLAVGVLGVLFISGEYGTGMIRSTLAAVPRRLPVLWAKLAVYVGVVLVLMEFAAFIGFFGGQAALAGHGTSISAPGALRAVVGTGLYLAVVALIGTALGFLIRSTAGGIAALVGILLVLPGVMNILPQSWQDTIAPYLPSNAGAALWDLHPEGTSLAPWAGFAVFCLWGAIAVAAAAFTLNQRDG